MADNVTNDGTVYVWRSTDNGGVHSPHSKIEFDDGGTVRPVSSTNPLPVSTDVDPPVRDAGSANAHLVNITGVKTLRFDAPDLTEQAIGAPLSLGVPCYIFGMETNTSHAGTISLRDAAALGGGSEPVFARSSSFNMQWGVQFENGVTIQASDAAGDVYIFYKVLGTAP